MKQFSNRFLNPLPLKFLFMWSGLGVAFFFVKMIFKKYSLVQVYVIGIRCIYKSLLNLCSFFVISKARNNQKWKHFSCSYPDSRFIKQSCLCSTRSFWIWYNLLRSMEQYSHQRGICLIFVSILKLAFIWPLFKVAIDLFQIDVVCHWSHSIFTCITQHET